jgi:hypothetical protein
MSGADGRRCVIVHPDDCVATLLDDRRTADRLQDGRACAPGVPFGHKVALRAIGSGEPVVKYGVTIGVATRPISEGEHVHVHNCR